MSVRASPLHTAAALLPGAFPTVVAPLLMFWVLPAAQYARLEAVAVAASLLAIAVGGGRSIRLPYDCLECGRTDALARLQRVLDRWGWGLLALSLLPRMGAVAVEQASSAWHWLPTLIALTAGFLTQTFIAAALKVQGRPAASAFAEHAIWHVWMVMALAAAAWPLAIGPDLLHTIAVLHTALLLALSRAVLHGRNGAAAGEARGGLREAPAWPLMLGQFATVGGLALVRLVLLACKQPEAAAQAALAFRLALPVIFVAQAMNVAGLTELFNAAPQRKAAAIARLITRVNLFCGAWLALLLSLNAWVGSPLLAGNAGFAACLVLAVSTTALLTTRNIASAAAVADGRVWQRTAGLLAVLPLAAIGTAAVAAGGSPVSPSGSMLAAWLVLTGVCAAQMGRLAPMARGALLTHAAVAVVLSLAAMALN
jgi:hypothetical protein